MYKRQTHKRRRRGSGGGQLRSSEPPIDRLMTPCLGGCTSFCVCHVSSVFFGGSVVSRVLCVVSWLLHATIRTCVVMYLVRPREETGDMYYCVFRWKPMSATHGRPRAPMAVAMGDHGRPRDPMGRPRMPSKPPPWDVPFCTSAGSCGCSRGNTHGPHMGAHAAADVAAHGSARRRPSGSPHGST